VSGADPLFWEKLAVLAVVIVGFVVVLVKASNGPKAGV